MGYFASLLHHTGIQTTDAVASFTPADPGLGIDHDETRVAELPSQPPGTLPMAPLRPTTELNVAPAPTTPTPKPVEHPSLSLPRVSEPSTTPAPSIEQPLSTPECDAVHVPLVTHASPTTPIMQPERRSDELIAPLEIVRVEQAQPVVAPPKLPVIAAAPAPAKPDADRPDPRLARSKRLPTLADVQAWVAQPRGSMDEPPPAESQPVTTVGMAVGSLRGTDGPEPYSLEIGTIQIVVDDSSAPAPTRPASPARPVVPDQLAPGRASRHYLRP